MYKNRQEQEAAEKRMAKNAKICGIISLAFILGMGLAGYFYFGLSALL